MTICGGLGEGSHLAAAGTARLLQDVSITGT
jgi:hypothetical protein